MTDEKIIEAMAGLEGFTYKKLWPSGRPRWNPHKLYSEMNVSGNEVIHPPKYTESHDAVQRVIDAATSGELSSYWHTLHLITKPMGARVPSMCIYEHVIRATPRHKCIAILKVKGLWGE